VAASSDAIGPLLRGPKPAHGAKADAARPARFADADAAAGAPDKHSLARLLFGLGEAQFTGAIRVLAPILGGEERHEMYLRLGRVVHVRPPYLDEPLGHILSEMGLLDHETYARSLHRMAEERARHGTVLRRMGVVSEEQLAGALAVQILRRAARMFRLRAGRYSIDPHDHEHGRPEDGEVAVRGVGVRRVIYHGVVSGYAEADLVWELNLVAGRRVRLRREEARRLGRYGFGAEARPALELLSHGFCELSNLLAVAGDAPEHSTDLLKVIYTLLVTELIEVEQPEVVIDAAPTEVTPPRYRVTTPRPTAEPQPVPGRRLVSGARGPSAETLERLRKRSPHDTRPPRAPEPDPKALEGKARFLRGEAFLRKGEHELALANLKAAAQLLPRDPDVRALLALAVWRGKNEDQRARAAHARRLLAEALGLAPTCARAYRVFGVLYAELGEVEQAIRCYARVLELLPDDVEAAREREKLERRRGGLRTLFRR
jgi:tetratricopeptide (TPR) repeat protein